MAPASAGAIVSVWSTCNGSVGFVAIRPNWAALRAGMAPASAGFGAGSVKSVWPGCIGAAPKTSIELLKGAEFCGVSRSASGAVWETGANGIPANCCGVNDSAGANARFCGVSRSTSGAVSETGANGSSGDCCKMKWSDFDGEYMSVIQQKTGTPLTIYTPSRLQDYLVQLPKRGTFILAQNLTQHLGKRAVQKSVETVREAIGVAGIGNPDRLVVHGWRYTAVTQLADAGVSDSDIQAVSGHKTLAMIIKYRQKANQKKASKRAQIARWSNRRTEKYETRKWEKLRKKVGNFLKRANAKRN
jgi:hypothetical protein